MSSITDVVRPTPAKTEVSKHRGTQKQTPETQEPLTTSSRRSRPPSKSTPGVTQYIHVPLDSAPNLGDQNGDMGCAPIPALTSSQVDAYFARLKMPTSTKLRKPCLSLLNELHLKHHMEVSWNTSTWHLPKDWEQIAQTNPDRPFTIMPKDASGNPQHHEEVFDRVIMKGMGGHCHNLTVSFARLLKSLGFSTSFALGRVTTKFGVDPKKSGYAWGLGSHSVLIVAWPDLPQQPNECCGETGYLADIGFGLGSSPIAMKLVHDSETEILGERYRLRHESLPGFDDGGVWRQGGLGWTAERWVGRYWSPIYHVARNRVTTGDIAHLAWWSTYIPTTFPAMALTVVKSLPDGGRRVLTCTEKPYATIGTKVGIISPQTDVKQVPATYGSLWKVCQEEFGFGTSPFENGKQPMVKL